MVVSAKQSKILATGYKSSRTSRRPAEQEPAGSRYALLVPVCLQCKSTQALCTNRLGPGSTDEQLAVEVAQEGGVMYVYGQLRLDAGRHWNDLRLRVGASRPG